MREVDISVLSPKGKLINCSSEIQMNIDDVEIMNSSLISGNSRRQAASFKSKSKIAAARLGFGRIHTTNMSEVTSFLAEGIQFSQSRVGSRQDISVVESDV
jgi:hypothetical protein